MKLFGDPSLIIHIKEQLEFEACAEWKVNTAIKTNAIQLLRSMDQPAVTPLGGEPVDTRSFFLSLSL